MALKLTREILRESTEEEKETFGKEIGKILLEEMSTKAADDGPKTILSTLDSFTSRTLNIVK